MTETSVSIIITAYNYDEYLEACLDSALNQTYNDYEIIVVDDGSTDNTPEILREYTYEYPDRIKKIRLDGKGLPAASNTGIKAAEGEYIIRLDADDIFDENILTVQANYLNSHPEIGLVYPDYYTIDADGELLDHVRLPEVGDEVKLLNRNPLAAGAMYRKSAWEAIGGYNEDLDYQEDFDFWIRFINQFSVRNVNLPLMYYRQHGTNMSQNLSGRLDARREVKAAFVAEHLGDQREDTEILAVIPARAEQRIDVEDEMALALRSIANRPLIEYTVREALAAEGIDRVVVDTEDAKIADAARSAGADVPFLRNPELADRSVMFGELVINLIERLDDSEGYTPDLVVILPYVTPLTTADLIDEVVNTWFIFSVDSVISVHKNDKFQWQPGKYGLEPLFDERLIREERETLYQENGAIYLLNPDLPRHKNDIIGEHVGHVLMERSRSIHIDSIFDLRCCEAVLEDPTNDLYPSYRSQVLADE